MNRVFHSPWPNGCMTFSWWCKRHSRLPSGAWLLNQNWQSSQGSSRLDNFWLGKQHLVRNEVGLWLKSACSSSKNSQPLSSAGCGRTPARRTSELLSDGGRVVLTNFQTNATFIMRCTQSLMARLSQIREKAPKWNVSLKARFCEKKKKWGGGGLHSRSKILKMLSPLYNCSFVVITILMNILYFMFKHVSWTSTCYDNKCCWYTSGCHSLSYLIHISSL